MNGPGTARPLSAATLWDLVAQTATRHPDRRLLTDEHGQVLTAGEFRQQAEGLARRLAGRGVGRGTVVSWQLPTASSTMVLTAALSRLGAVQNPLIPQLREAELRFITRQVGTDLMIVPEEWRGFGYGPLARGLAAELGFQALVLESAGAASGPVSDLFPGEDGLLPPPPEEGASCRWVYYSSGTTAEPKGVRHSDTSVMAGSSGVVALVGGASDDVNPLAFPIAHIGGVAMLTAALRTGMQLVLFESFDPVTSPAAIAACHPTLLGSATPFFLAFMAAQREAGPERLFPRLRACLGGGAPITPELGRQVREVLGVGGVANAWGLTEFPVATSPAPDAAPAVLDHTVGPPVPGVRVRVVAVEGVPSEEGEGELRLKGPQCFLGYVDADLDRDAFDEEGWFRTGDLGRVDTQGNVVITGRIKDAIIRNAENISAREVELVLAAHPLVADVAVVGLPDPRTGERVCAVLVPRAPGTDLSVAQIGEHCARAGLARYKHPERVEVVQVLPRNSAGKVLKRELQDRYR